MELWRYPNKSWKYKFGGQSLFSVFDQLAIQKTLDKKSYMIPSFVMHFAPAKF